MNTILIFKIYSYQDLETAVVNIQVVNHQVTLLVACRIDISNKSLPLTCVQKKNKHIHLLQYMHFMQDSLEYIKGAPPYLPKKYIIKHPLKYSHECSMLIFSLKNMYIFQLHLLIARGNHPIIIVQNETNKNPTTRCDVFSSDNLHMQLTHFDP